MGAAARGGVWVRSMLAGAAALALLAPGVASADKISNAEAECRRKKEGDACSVSGERGACVERTLERPRGTKRWLECSPGKRPKRRPPPAEDKTIDEAGPVGVLPALTTGEGAESTGGEGTTGSIVVGLDGTTAGEVPVQAAAVADTLAQLPAPAPAPATELAEDKESRGCAIAGEGSPAEALAGLSLLLLGLRRRRAP
ncbi:MAG: hypothetical protein R3A79_28345 [Nannocystaceae bacterium]